VMINRRKFVIDTNVIISAVLLPKSKPILTIKKAQNLEDVLISAEVWSELEQVLARPKFNRYITLEERQKFLGDLSESITLIIKITKQINVCRDAKDNKYLELAVSGNAEAIITGDTDLLVLSPFRDIQILTHHEFLVETLDPP